MMDRLHCIVQPLKAGKASHACWLRQRHLPLWYITSWLLGLIFKKKKCFYSCSNPTQTHGTTFPFSANTFNPSSYESVRSAISDPRAPLPFVWNGLDYLSKMQVRGAPESCFSIIIIVIIIMFDIHFCGPSGIRGL